MTTTIKTRFLRFFSILLTVSTIGAALVDLLLKDNAEEQGISNLLSFLLSPVIVACILLGLMLTVLYHRQAKHTLLSMVLALLAADGYLCGIAIVNVIIYAWDDHWKYGRFAFRNIAFLVFELTSMIAAILLLVALAKIVRGSGKRFLPVTASILYGMIGVTFIFSRAMAVGIYVNYYSMIESYPRILLGAALTMYFLHDRKTASFPVQAEKAVASGSLKTWLLRLSCILLTVASVCAMIVYLYLQKDMAGAPCHELGLILRFFWFPQTIAQFLFVLALTAWYRDKAKKRALLTVVMAFLTVYSYLICLTGNLTIVGTVVFLAALASLTRGSEKRAFPVTASILYGAIGVMEIAHDAPVLVFSCILFGVALALYFACDNRGTPTVRPVEN